MLAKWLNLRSQSAANHFTAELDRSLFLELLGQMVIIESLVLSLG